jgi:hypothetical protein
LHDIGAVLDFKKKTITIDGILLPMRNIVNLQLKPSATRALRHITCQAQEPISTQTATKRVIKILDAKYDKADLPAIVNDSCSHLTPLQREKLLSLLLKYELLFDGTLDDWNRPPISIELKEGAKPTASDLNMGCYTIRLDPQAVEMFTIIFPWGKYSYLRLPMGYAGSADIFQAEMMDLMEALEYVRAYIDDLHH